MLRLSLLAGMVVVNQSRLLFRRGSGKPTRDDAFQDLFEALDTLYQSAAQLKPDWRTQWSNRSAGQLPPKYDFGNPTATAAAQAMRFATALLQRHRWRSQVQPLFESYDESAWARVQRAASDLAPVLAATAENHVDRLTGEERDWIEAAIEQLDEATRRRRLAERDNSPAHQRVAEGTYQALYLAIQLSDRLIERLRFEASQRDGR
jgi:hypothetical protein